MSSRVGLRFFRNPRMARVVGRRPIGRRHQTADAAAAVPPSQSVFTRLWNSPIGIKTVHFWAPVMKWGLVLAGISDFWRPVEKLSLSQNLALVGTGAIWTRWCFVIKPRNLLLAAVNFFLACVGTVQVTRILVHQRSVKNESLAGVLKEDAKDMANTADAVKKDGEGKARAAVR